MVITLFFAHRSKLPNDILTNRQHYQYLPETTIKNMHWILWGRSSSERFACIFGIFVNRFMFKGLSATLQEVHWKRHTEQFCEQIKSCNQWHNMYAWLNRAESGGFVRENNTTTVFGLIFSELFAVVFMNGATEIDTRAVGSNRGGIQRGWYRKLSMFTKWGQLSFSVERPTWQLHVKTMMCCRR